MDTGGESEFDSQTDPSSTTGDDTGQAAEVPDYEVPEHEYPPDAFVERYLPFSFTQAFVALAFLATAASLIRVGFPDTGIPYNYPLFAGLIYIVAVLLILRRFHSIFEETKHDLANVLDRTKADKAIFERDSDYTPEKLVEEMEWMMDWAFHPAVIFFGGLIGGVFALVVMGALGVFDAYPYLMLNYAYGAGHGFFYGPFAGSAYLIVKISNDYIIDVDILAPDGVGGYRGVGDAIVTLIIYGIGLVTLDFVILSSVSFVDRPLFETAALALYGLMLGFLLILTLVGVMSLRWRLLTIRERKTEALREHFKLMEVNYWRKLDGYEDPEPEATHIATMNTMFEQLQSMALWPINLAAFARLAVATGFSIGVALLKSWLTSGDLPAVVTWLPV